VIVDIDVLDPQGYEEYKRLAPAAVQLFGEKYLARGGYNEALEGDWKPNRLVILEFETIEKARSWLESPEYKPARKLRHQFAHSAMVAVEGV
jgi:uncharacterized protein (DUF1330 family)